MPTTQTVTPTTGTDGAVKNRTGSQNVILASITSWDLQKTVQVAPLLTFGSAANAHGVVFPTAKYPTTGDWSVSFAGVQSIDSDDAQSAVVGFGDGADVIMDLLTSKGSGVGYPSCKGIIKDFKTGAKMGNELQTFTATLDGYGIPPAFGAVS